MNQHSIQEAYFKPFRNSDDKIWVYPKDGSGKFHKPTSWCTAETDFQSEILERSQANIIESSGIEALRVLLSARQLTDSEYDLLLQWIALHMLRNQRMRNAPMKTIGDYEREFPCEIEKELIYLQSNHKFLHVYTCTGSNFFVTSDDPLIEFCHAGQNVLVFVVSPHKLVLLSPRSEIFNCEENCFEDFVNSMIWSKAFKYIFSHSDAVDTGKLDKIAEKWHMLPCWETQRYVIKGLTGGLPNRFQPQS